MSRLTYWQLKAIGKGYCPMIWNKNLAHLYPAPLDENLLDDEKSISQSYDEFQEYGDRLPNEEGTGRFLVGFENRHSIYLMNLKGCAVDSKLVKFVSAFFGMPVMAKVTEMTAQLKLKKRSFEDISQNCSFPLKAYKGGKMTDVFSVFDVAVEYLPVDAYTAALLVDFPIVEEGKEIYGRACGDRVAVISSHDITDRREYFLVVLHELLHTFGIDHCESFACIMNPASGATNTLELCPSELRKLQTAVQGLDLLKRWRELEGLCRDEGWLEDADWFAERLRLTK